jgi:hypothetical protein
VGLWNSTALVISTPNIPSDLSFHQVLQIYLLSKSVPLQFQSITSQNESMPALSIHPWFSSILFINPKHTALHKLQEFLSLSIHFDCWILFIWILKPSCQFTIHSFHAFLLSLSSFWHHASNIYSSFLKPCFKAVCQLLLSILSPTCYTFFSPSLIARYYLTYIHHTTLRVTWAPCLTLESISSIL